MVEKDWPEYETVWKMIEERVKNTNTIWIVKAHSEKFGKVYLTDYAGQTKSDVYNKIERNSYYKGNKKRKTGAEIAKELGWEIIQVEIKE